MRRMLHGVLLACCLTARVVAEDAANEVPPHETAIRARVAEYVKAFNAGDAAALANLWSEQAVYTNLLTGETAEGRTQIAAQFRTLFETAKKVRIELATESIELLSPNVAVEHGQANLLDPEGDPERIQYTAVYVLQGGRWLLDRVTDEESLQNVSHYEQLKPLEWMVGSWTTAEGPASIQLECNWTANRNYLTRAFAIDLNGSTVSGMQIIGWDPAAKAIRSWTFDSDGGFAEGSWSQRNDQWFVQNKGTLADGRSATMLNVLRAIDENAFAFKTLDRTAAGELLPNLPEVALVRQ